MNNRRQPIRRPGGRADASCATRRSAPVPPASCPSSGQRPARAVEGIRGRFMVVINMLGGNDGLNTVVPSHASDSLRRTGDPRSTCVENRPGGDEPARR